MMNRRTCRQQRCRYLIPVLILLVGLGSAFLIYRAAEQGEHGVLAYEEVDGYLSPVAPEDSKAYNRNLELYGGKANVLASEFSRWFAGLWHGKSLAFTVASISLLTASVCFFVAYFGPDADH